MFVGVDPGLRRVGFAVIDNSCTIQTAGIIFDDTSDDLVRLNEIFTFFDDLFIRYSPTVLVIEQFFFTHKNKEKAGYVFAVRYMVMMLAHRLGIRIVEIHPCSLKKVITGRGNAKKFLVKQMISRIFSLTNTPTYADAADALGLAFYGFCTYKSQ